MAENVFEGFEALDDIAGMFINKPGSKKPEEPNEIPEVDPNEIINEGEEDNDNNDSESEKEASEDNVKNESDDEESDDEATSDEGSEDDTGEGEEESEDEKSEDSLSEFEPDITSFLQKRLEEEIGIEFSNDIKIESIGDLVQYLDTIVEEASKPKFANDEMAKLNSFIEEGGKLEDYIKIGPAELDLETIDLENENNQKQVVRELLQAKGYSEERIKKTLIRYEDAGVLEDEAQDAVELLKDYKEKDKQKLLDDTKKTKQLQLEQQQKFVSNVQEIVNDMDSIRGIKISSGEKKELLDYIFRPGADGMTQYQKDYASDIKNLIESAYFTKKGDALIERAQKKASSEANRQLHQKLKANKQKRQKGSGSGSISQKSNSGLSALSKALMNN